MNEMNVSIAALTAWRENRHGGEPGMHSVINVIYNRAKRNKSTAYIECVKRLQFSSMTAPGDPQLGLWPSWGDPEMADALSLAGQAEAGELEDLTEGSTLYYNPRGIETKFGKTIAVDGNTYKFPDTWNLGAADYVITIANHLFFREV